MSRPGLARVGLLACVGLTSVGCELEEITVVEVRDAVIVEVYVNVAQPYTENRVVGFVHRTVGTGVSDLEGLVSTRLRVRRPSDGFEVPLQSEAQQDCIETLPVASEGVCFTADPSLAEQFRPLDRLELSVELDGGGRLDGATTVPGAFELGAVGEVCRLDPDQLMPFHWSPSEGAWAYVNETSIRGLPDALEPEGIEVEDDPLYLLGLSVSAADTTIVFPSEFGVFNRFELDQDLAVRLQRGLPAGTRAEVSITAVGRSYVNWARGGSFNPSGQVRVPSLRGDGTGVFAATVRRRAIIQVNGDPSSPLPACPT